MASLKDRQIRQHKFYPQDIDLQPANEGKAILKPDVNTVIALLFGATVDGSRRVDATLWNALKVSAYGSAYTEYAVKSGSVPAAYGATHALTIATGYYHRWDFLIEAQEASIIFYNDKTASWGSDIPLTVGNHSIEFTSNACRIKYRSVTGGTYTIVGYR